MKKLTFLIFSIFYYSIIAQAQTTDTLKAANPRFYVGLGLNGRYFEVSYNHQNYLLKNSGYFHAKPYLHFGYKLNKRIRLEAGVAYVNDKDHYYVTYVEAPKSYINYHDYNQTKGFVIPLKITHDFFHVFKGKVAVYGTGTILPTYSKTRVWKVEEKADVFNTTLDIQDSALSTFASLGIGASVRIWKKFSGYHEVNIWNRNLTSGRNMDPFSNVRSQIPLSHLSFGIGLNYDLNL
ncbi:outer membrane beta-barrel protein [Rufibacter hautae]|uniref:Outer membrane beta-barrel protein n=1 Tax=Rufibacter hautae TaxID=2595005 RepID=A0A5B6TG08_9BACT|nr:outer membrane beta-barrel protein [Rufibacter hautae]KAA3438235.1 outer membrane beta-barrel protein [Rufibacter hautae]